MNVYECSVISWHAVRTEEAQSGSHASTLSDLNQAHTEPDPHEHGTQTSTIHPKNIVTDDYIWHALDCFQYSPT